MTIVAWDDGEGVAAAHFRRRPARDLRGRWAVYLPPRLTAVYRAGVAFGSPQEPITQVLTYNARNELTGSERDDSAALTRTYAYDPIGNRTAATQNEAPDADTIAYVRNALNQYKQVAATGQGGTLKQGLSYDEDGNLVERFIAGDMDCDGDVDMDDIDPFLVALQGQAAYEAQYPNCNWLHADIDGDGDVDLDDLDVFVNLLSSGNAAVWLAYAWDAENRLVGVEPAGTPKSGDLKIAFVYDYMGRRVEKKVWTWDPQAGQGGAWVLTGHRKFVWNGWLLLMELDGLNDDAVLRKRTWGLDLSGLMGGGASAGLASGRSTLAGAGGIGGLLAVYDTNGTTTGEDPEADDMAYVYFYDANGNVGQLVDLSHTPDDPAGAIVARYEYDPYGNVTSQSGTYAAANPFRFSTKYWDDETGLGYWGYRYYDPKLGRWVNRDPIGELGGHNLYASVRNRPVDMSDPDGRREWGGGTGSWMRPPRECPTGPLPPIRPLPPTTQPTVPYCTGQACTDYCKDPRAAATVFCEKHSGNCVPCTCVCPEAGDRIIDIELGGKENNSPGRKKAAEIIRKCITAQEEHHAKNDVTCSPPNMGGNCSSSPNPRPGFTECGGEIATLECLKRSIGECGADKDCVDLVKKAAATSNRYCQRFGSEEIKQDPYAPPSYKSPCPESDRKRCEALNKEIQGMK